MNKIDSAKSGPAEIIADHSYAQKPLVLAPELGDITVTGTLKIDNISSWVKSLERAFDLNATEESDRISITRNQKTK